MGFIYERTDGNALFMVNMLEHLVQQGEVVRRGGWALREGAEAAGVQEGLRQLLVRRLAALEPGERKVLEAASVAGEAFTAAAVSAGVQGAVEEVEAVCEALAAPHHFIEETGLMVWPDGTVSGGYQFQHVLYQQVLYEQLGEARRAQLHRRIGTRLEAGYDAQAGEVAVQLAVHFERGGRRSGPRGRGSRRGPRPPGAAPITRRSPPSAGGWRCWRRGRPVPRAPGRNSPCCSRWGIC
jgi:predicted ATPase